MKCSQIEEVLIPYVDGMLSKEESKAVEAHIDSCTSCQVLLKETQTLFLTMQDVDEVEPGANVRQRFMTLLEEEKRLQRPNGLGGDTQKEFPWKTAFQIAASIVLLLSGYLFGSFQEGKKSEFQLASLQEETLELKQDMLLALLDNKSASKRIQAVSYTSEMDVTPDMEVIEALIERFEYDGNINVRLAAAEALSNYSENETVKTAFIASLTNEKNPTIQIAVIQFLVKVQDKRALVPMQQLLEQTETPNYVKEQVNQGLQQFI